MARKMRFVVPDRDDESTWKCAGWVPDMVDRRGKVVMMRPQTYLRVVDPGFVRDVLLTPAHHKRSIDWLHQAADAGACFAPPRVTHAPRGRYDPSMRRVLPHDGRHRAYVAAERGVKRIPVIIWK